VRLRDAFCLLCGKWIDVGHGEHTTVGASPWITRSGSRCLARENYGLHRTPLGRCPFDILLEAEMIDQEDYLKKLREYRDYFSGVLERARSLDDEGLPKLRDIRKGMIAQSEAAISFIGDLEKLSASLSIPIDFHVEMIRSLPKVTEYALRITKLEIELLSTKARRAKFFLQADAARERVEAERKARVAKEARELNDAINREQLPRNPGEA
jgi:hypothetical protein